MDKKHHEIINTLWKNSKDNRDYHLRAAKSYQEQADALEAMMTEVIKPILNSKEAEKCKWWKRRPRNQR